MMNQNNTQSLSTQAYERIKQMIVSLQLPPGAVIDESLLQEELGLGRTPIREALKRLSLERLVTIVPRRGMFVTEIHITDLQRLYEVRLELECLTARLAARRGTAVHWQKMQQALDQVLGKTAASIPPELLIKVDETCHTIMYDAADNTFLRDTLSPLYALNLRLWYLYLDKLGHHKNEIVEYKHIHEHQAILEALQAEDGALAETLMQQHITAYHANIRQVMIDAQTETAAASAQ